MFRTAITLFKISSYTGKTVSTELDATANVAVKTIATDLEGCPSYPSKVVVPVVISDLDLIRGMEFYR